jgi:protein-L-isoaspartate O-methyltransferase
MIVNQLKAYTTMTMGYEKDKRHLFNRILAELRDQTVVDAMMRVPRERFVPVESEHLAYADRVMIESGVWRG